MSNVDSPSRRQFLRITAVTGAMGMGTQALPNGPVQESEAIAPVVVAGAAAAAGGGGIGLGWALRDYEILGADEPPKGLTPGALESKIRDTTRTRKSTNASTIVDNKNILDGISGTTWGDAKIAAIEALNDQKKQSEVLQAAKDAIADYEKTVVQNLLKSWNESVRELDTLYKTASSHEDVNAGNYIQFADVSGNGPWDYWQGIDWNGYEKRTVELSQGNKVEVLRITPNVRHQYSDFSTSTHFSPVSGGQTGESAGGGHNSWSYTRAVQITAGEEGHRYLKFKKWNDIYTTLTDEFQTVKDEIGLWVDKIYGEVQSGQLDTEELLTPRELAKMTTEKEDFNQAIADLQALNVAVDSEREAEIRLPDRNATVYGTLAYSGDGTLKTGVIKPSEREESIYLTYDISQGNGEWQAHTGSLDGGILTFTKEPFPKTLYQIKTTAGESVEVTADDFEEADDAQEWTVDLSDKLENPITNIEGVNFYAETEETEYETVRLRNKFEIIKFTDSEGNEYESADFERSEPHNDTNYITKEEWKERQKKQEELIKKYEESKGGGMGIGFIGDAVESMGAGVALVGAAIFVFLFGR